MKLRCLGIHDFLEDAADVLGNNIFDVPFYDDSQVRTLSSQLLVVGTSGRDGSLRIYGELAG